MLVNCSSLTALYIVLDEIAQQNTDLGRYIMEEHTRMYGVFVNVTILMFLFWLAMVVLEIYVIIKNMYKNKPPLPKSLLQNEEETQV